MRKSFTDEMHGIKNPKEKDDAFMQNIIKQVWPKLKEESKSNPENKKSMEGNSKFHVLSRLGLDRTLRIQYNAMQEHKKIKKFPKENIFHISQIRKMAIKYRLRFANPRDYMGTVDADLADAVSKFENEILERPLHKSDIIKLLCPAESLEIKPEPIDPLLFLELNNDYYYLIHQWGNNLSWFRKVTSFPMRSIKTLATITIALGIIGASLVPILSLKLGLWYISEIGEVMTIFGAIVGGLVLGVGPYITKEEKVSSKVWDSDKFLATREENDPYPMTGRFTTRYNLSQADKIINDLNEPKI